MTKQVQTLFLVVAAFASICNHASTVCAQAWPQTSAPSNSWMAVACSADGLMLVAVVNGGGIYISQTTPAPLLSVSSFDNNLLFTWTVSSLNFGLLQTSDLTSGNWSPVPLPPILDYTNLQYKVTMPKPDGAVFCRLVSE